MPEYTIRDSKGLSSGASDLVTLKLSPQQAFRLAMNLLQQCQSKVEDRQDDYITFVTFTAQVDAT